jgi:hypothetical protein
MAALVAFGLLGGAAWLRSRGIDTTTSTTTPAGSATSATPAAILDPKDIVEVIPADGIPAIDDPRFIEPSEADWLGDREPVIAVELGGEARAYPLQIMTWHEIVNDTIGETPISVTFCPLCNTAIAFERPAIDGAITTFGTSGKLINSNLLMYDRATESLWPQVTGVALTGPMKGDALRRLPAQIVAWGDFQDAFPGGVVLSRDTGFDRRYGDNPYPGYDDVDSAPFLYSGEVDGRLAAVERIIGVSHAGHQIAFPYFRLRERASGGASVAQDQLGGFPVVVFWKKGTTSALDRTEFSVSRDVGSASAFSRRVGDQKLSFIVEDGAVIDTLTRSRWNIFGRATAGQLKGRRLKPAEATDSFWFDWAAFYPDTEVWDQ